MIVYKVVRELDTGAYCSAVTDGPACVFYYIGKKVEQQLGPMFFFADLAYVDEFMKDLDVSRLRILKCEVDDTALMPTPQYVPMVSAASLMKEAEMLCRFWDSTYSHFLEMDPDECHYNDYSYVMLQSGVTAVPWHIPAGTVLAKSCTPVEVLA